MRLPGELRDFIFRDVLTVGVIYINPARQPKANFVDSHSSRKIPFSALLKIPSI